MNFSLRNRILWMVLCLLGPALGFMTYKSYHDAYHETEELFDAQLAQSARLLAGLLGHDPDATQLARAQQTLNEALDHLQIPGTAGHPYESKVGFQIFTRDGTFLLHSASIPDDLLTRLRAAHGGAPLRPGYHDILLGDYRWRLFLTYTRQNHLWVLAAEREDIRGELTDKIARRNLMPDLIGLPLIALMVWAAVKWGLRPLDLMVERLKSRAPDSLTPLLLDRMPRELDPMVAALNRLLLQVNHLLEHEKRILADAAHELRTPLAVLSIHQQNAVSARTSEAREEALHQLGEGVQRATRVVGQLLTLARLDPGQRIMSRTEVDLGMLVRNELAELTPLALQKHQDLSLDVQDPQLLSLQADPGWLAILIQNLVSNAINYTPEGGQIHLSLSNRGQCLLMRVEDSGPGVPRDLRHKLFERFFRNGPGQGAGLGLSIVARIIELHQGRIELLASADLGGLQVDVQLPLTPSAPSTAGS